MILQPPAKEEFDFQNDIRVDTENRGFSPAEMKKLVGPPPPEFADDGAKGIADWLNSIWSANRAPEIQNLKSEFGYQKKPFLTDLVTIAKAQGTPLEGTIQARSPKYNFYLMPCGVYILPQGGEKFEALKFEVHYKDDNASTYAMLPGPQTEKILELGGKADIGFSAKGEFGFPSIPLPLQGANLSASARAELEAKFIVSFHYELKTQVVDAFGAQNGFCRWLMYKGDKLRNDVVFYPVIMTPASVTEFECEFKAYFKINHSDWDNAEFFLKPPMTIRVST
jgi:hypothetical protein